MASKLFDVIFEDEALLVVNKPAGLVCHPTKGDAYSSLISRVRSYLGDSSKPHLVNRLDRETSGVTVIAKTSEVAGELGRVWEARSVQKEYFAIVHGTVAEDKFVVDAPLGNDEASRVAIKDCVRPDGAPAQTSFEVFERFVRAVPLNVHDFELHGIRQTVSTQGNFSLLRIVPHTGRKHQIRIHLAHVGHPIVGDKIYGGDEELYLSMVGDRLNDKQRARLLLPHHALHASALRFAWRGQHLEFTARPEAWFSDFVASSKESNDVNRTKRPASSVR